MGAKGAYDFVATTPELSATATPITRSKTIADITTGYVTLYIATADGAPVGGDVTIVQAAIDKLAEPWTANATAVGATNHAIAVTYQVWVQASSLTVAQIKAGIAAALSRYMSAAPIGGFIVPPDTGDIYVEEIEGVVRNATLGVLRVAVTVPAADVVLAVNEVPTLGTVIGTVTVL